MIILRLGLAAEHQSLSWLAHHFTKGGTSKEVAMMSKAAQLSNFYMDSRPAGERSIRPRRLVYGAGVNDAPYCVSFGKNVCPAYRCWIHMLERAYCKKHKEKKPTYTECFVSAQWLSFMAFRSWWICNHRDGFQLDKDLLLIGNKVYGPDMCCFVPDSINTFLTDSGAIRGEFPIGVSYHKHSDMIRASCKDGSGKLVHLGYFSNQTDAHLAWQKYKLARLEDLRAEMDAIDPRIYVNAKAKIMSHAEGLNL